MRRRGLDGDDRYIPISSFTDVFTAMIAVLWVCCKTCLRYRRVQIMRCPSLPAFHFRTEDLCSRESNESKINLDSALLVESVGRNDSQMIATSVQRSEKSGKDCIRKERRRPCSLFSCEGRKVMVVRRRRWATHSNIYETMQQLPQRQSIPLSSYAL